MSLQNYQQGTSVGESQQLVGEIMAQLSDDEIQVDVKNRFALNDELLLLTPEGNYRFSAQEIRNKQGQAVSVAPGSGHIVSLKIPRVLMPPMPCW